MPHPTCDTCRQPAAHRIEVIQLDTGHVLSTVDTCSNCAQPHIDDLTRQHDTNFVRLGRRIVISDWQLVRDDRFTNVWTRQLQPTRVL